MAMFNNSYTPNYYLQDLQGMRDRIDRTIQHYQHQQMQQAQPTPITQNFQLAPNTSNTELEAKYANSIDEVRTTFVIKTGIFTTKDFSTIWIKDANGNIKTFKTEEVIELDEKDKKIKEQDDVISSLQKQINELKGVILNATDNNNSVVDEPVTAKKSTRVSNSTKLDE